MDFFWLIQNIFVSLIIIILIHYLYLYLIDNFTETKILDSKNIETNYQEILQAKQSSLKSTKQEDNICIDQNEEELNTSNRNMEEELKLYLQQQINEQLK
jgi:hypothetical protein